MNKIFNLLSAKTIFAKSNVLPIRRIYYMILSVILLSFLGGSFSFKTEAAAEIYTDENNALWADKYYDGYEKQPVVLYYNEDSTICIEFNMYNEPYPNRSKGRLGKGTARIDVLDKYAFNSDDGMYTEIVYTDTSQYENGRGQITIPKESLKLSNKPYYYQVVLYLPKEDGNYLTWYVIDMMYKDNRAYFNHICPQNTVHNYHAYEQVIGMLETRLATEYENSFNKRSDLRAEESKKWAQKLTENIAADKEKANSICEWIVNNIIYDIWQERYHYADEVLQNKKGGCMEIALLTRAMLNAVGIPCVYVSSDASNHAWNLAYINGRWNMIDNTIALSTDNDLYAACSYFWIDAEVQTLDIYPEIIELKESNIYLEERDTRLLTAVIFPKDAGDQSLVWSSSDETVATVDAHGMVTAKSVGTAKITVSSSVRSEVSAVCDVEVAKKKRDFKVIYQSNTAVSNLPIDQNSYKPGSTAIVKGALVSSSRFFAGWNTRADGKGIIYSPGNPIKITGNIILYAQWKTTYTDSNKLTYKINGKDTITCTGTKDIKEKAVKIPDAIKYCGITYKVTAVSKKAFYKNLKLTSVQLGKNVKTIGNNAFEKCRNLKKISLGTGVMIIGKHAFCYAKRGCVLTVKGIKLKTVKTAIDHGTRQMCVKVPKKRLKAYKKLFRKTAKKVNVIGKKTG